jgi:hypothetical protein
MSSSKEERQRRRLEARKIWVRDYLIAHNGQAPVSEIRAAAWSQLRVRATQLDRARLELGVRVKQSWTWHLPRHAWDETESRNESDSPEPVDEPEPDPDVDSDDPDKCWDVVAKGEPWLDCELCAARVRTLYRGAPRCRPSCGAVTVVDGAAVEDRGPDRLAAAARDRARAERSETDRSARAEELLRLRAEGAPQTRGDQWPTCARCRLPAQQLTAAGVCAACSRELR